MGGAGSRPCSIKPGSCFINIHSRCQDARLHIFRLLSYRAFLKPASNQIENKQANKTTPLFFIAKEFQKLLRVLKQCNQNIRDQTVTEAKEHLKFFTKPGKTYKILISWLIPLKPLVTCHCREKKQTLQLDFQKDLTPALYTSPVSWDPITSVTCPFPYMPPASNLSSVLWFCGFYCFKGPSQQRCAHSPNPNSCERSSSEPKIRGNLPWSIHFLSSPSNTE